jgi:hypothetical protein
MGRPSLTHHDKKIGLRRSSICNPVAMATGNRRIAPEARVANAFFLWITPLLNVAVALFAY